MVDFSWDAVDVAVPEPVDANQAQQWLAQAGVERLVHQAADRAMARFRNLSSREDVIAEGWLLLWEILSDPAARASARRIRPGLATALVVKLQDRMKRTAGADGRSAWQERRRRGLEFKRSAMVAELGRSVTDAEVVAAFNADRLAGNPDAARRGSLASLDDLRPATVDSFDESWMSPVVTDDDVPLMSHQARHLVDEVCQAATAAGGDLGVVVRAWLSGPDIATTDEIAEQTGLSRPRVRMVLVEARDLARTVLVERFGIAEA